MACERLGSSPPLETARQSIAAVVSEERKECGNQFLC